MPATVVRLNTYPDRLLMRAIHGELNRWGHWIESHADYTGFPSANVLVTALMGCGGNQPGHRVLMLDMPVEIWATHHRVLELTEALQDAVIATFVVRLKDDGTVWTWEEKCRKLGVDEGTMRRRIHRAKIRIAGLDEPVRSQVPSGVTSQKCN
jgi:hypothetical protein